jgi:hypothetical protein
MFPYIFVVEDEEDSEEGEERGSEDEDDGSGEANGGIEGFAKRWLWIDWCVRVREIYGCKLNEVFDLKIIEFFNLMCYIKEKQDIEAAEIKKIQNKYR